MKQTTNHKPQSYISKFIFLFVLALTLSNCQVEEEVITNHTFEAQIWFNNNITTKELPILSYTEDIDWKNAIVSEGEQGEIIEVPFTLKSGLKAKVGDENYLNYHRLLFKKSTDGFTYNHVQILTKNEYFDNIDKSFNFYQITDSFDGIVLVVNQQNEAVQFSSFKNSLLI